MEVLRLAESADRETRSRSPPDFRPPDEQPAWRQDFPIDWPQDQLRRAPRLHEVPGAHEPGVTVGQVWIAAKQWLRGQEVVPGQRARVNRRRPRRRLARPLRIPTEHDPCVLVRLTSAEFVAYSQKCTHLSCAVIPKPSEACCTVPVTNGFFDLRDGQPVAGPPRRPLPRSPPRDSRARHFRG